MSANLKHLAAFAAIARLRSFTAAARQLNLSQPALTVQIRQLEETMAVQLLERTTRSVRLTPVGEQMAPVVERLLAEVQSVVAGARALSGPAQETVRVAALPSVAATLLPRVITTFRKHHPAIRVSVRDVAAHAVADLVLTGEADLGLGIQIDARPGLAFTPLFRDRMCLVLPAGSPLLRKRHVELAELGGCPLILPERGSSVRLLVEQAFTDLGLRLEPAYEVSLMSTVAGMVRAGLGASILPAASFDMGELAGLRLRHLRAPELAREIGLLRKAARPLPQPVTRFVDELVASPAVAALRASFERSHL